MNTDLNRQETAPAERVQDSEQAQPGRDERDVPVHPTEELGPVNARQPNSQPREPQPPVSKQACHEALRAAGLPNDRLYSWIRHPETIARDLREVGSWPRARLYHVDDLLIIDERITPKVGPVLDLLILVGSDYPFHPPSVLLKETESGTLHILDLSGRTPVPSIPDSRRIALERIEQLVSQPQPETIGDTTCHEMQSI